MMAATKLTFLYLSEQDVINTGLTLCEATQLCTASFEEHGKKRIDNPPRVLVHPLSDAILHAMPAGIKQRNECGMKWVSAFSGNAEKKLPTLVGTICLNDTATGFPIAFMGGTYITAIRTAAVSGIAARCLARKDSEVLTIIGTGVQGTYHALCLTHILPSIKTIRILDKYESSMKSFQEAIGSIVGSKVTIEVAKSYEDAITGSDVIVTATSRLTETIFSDEWVKPGALVLPIHSRGWNKDVLVKMDKMVTDDWDQFIHFVSGRYDLPNTHTELSEVVTGKKPGRENDQERIIDFNIGLAVHDIVMAGRVLELAKKQGVGKKLELIDTSVPIPLPRIV